MQVTDTGHVVGGGWADSSYCEPETLGEGPVTTEAEMGMMQPQDKECCLPATTRG